jgi:hypothetical protein
MFFWLEIFFVLIYYERSITNFKRTTPKVMKQPALWEFVINADRKRSEVIW